MSAHDIAFFHKIVFNMHVVDNSITHKLILNQLHSFTNRTLQPITHMRDSNINEKTLTLLNITVKQTLGLYHSSVIQGVLFVKQ